MSFAKSDILHLSLCAILRILSSQVEGVLKMNLKTSVHRFSVAIKNSAAIKACTLLAASVLLAASPSFAQDKSEFVIRDVRIFDGARVIPSGQVWVQGGKIKAVGADVKAPASVRA